MCDVKADLAAVSKGLKTVLEAGERATWPRPRPEPSSAPGKRFWPGCCLQADDKIRPTFFGGMLLYPYPQAVDKTPFRAERPNKALYGLPLETKFCRSCVISNQRPSSTAEFKNDGKAPKQAINFDDQGICDACRVKEQKININWKQREEELRELCDRHRRTDGRYDCLYPKWRKR